MAIILQNHLIKYVKIWLIYTFLNRTVAFEVFLQVLINHISIKNFYFNVTPRIKLAHNEEVYLSYVVHILFWLIFYLLWIILNLFLKICTYVLSVCLRIVYGYLGNNNLTGFYTHLELELEAVWITWCVCWNTNL